MDIQINLSRGMRFFVPARILKPFYVELRANEFGCLYNY